MSTEETIYNRSKILSRTEIFIIEFSSSAFNYIITKFYVIGIL